MSTSITSALLKRVNDVTSAHPYGEGWLIDTPLTYSDGDTVTLLLSPMGQGAYRVSDRADSLDRLVLAGLRLDGRKARRAITSARRNAGLNQMASSDYELATICAEPDIGEAILRVAECAMRVEQLRWLAQERDEVQYADRLRERVSRLGLSRGWAVQERGALPLRGGRTRRVTAVISGPRAPIYVQAVSLRTAEVSVASCYYAFDRAEVPPPHRVSVLDGAPSDWDQGLADDLSTVSIVSFFDGGPPIESELARVVEEAQPASI